MAKVRVQVALERVGALAEDVVTNTFHFEDDEAGLSGSGIADAGNVPGLLNRLTTFYQSIAGEGFLSDLLSGNARMKVYDMNTPSPGRIPYAERTFTFVPSQTGTLPAEVAVCLSFNAAPLGGAVAARRRGRVYIGPVAQAVFEKQTADYRVKDTKIGTLIQAADIMAVGGAGTFRLAIFSPTIAGVNDGADAAWNDAARIWVDNAADTMRSRGARRTKRFQTAVGGSTSDFALFA